MSYTVEFKKNVTVNSKEAAKESILKVAKSNKIKIKAPCKKGKCGKCAVRVTSKTLPKPTKREKKYFSEEELNDGFRLACESYLADHSSIEILK